MLKIASFEQIHWPLKSEFWRARGLTFEALEIEVGKTFSEIWPELSRQADVVLLESKQVDEVLQAFTHLPTDVTLARACDVLVRENGKWWVRNLLTGALKIALVKRAPQLDTHCFAYVTGSTGDARSAISVMIEMGFSKIRWVSEKSNNLQVHLNTLRRNFFSIDINALDESELTLQPNNGAILVNTLSVQENSPLIEDLCYLNFIQKNGVVVDTHVLPMSNQLLEEATNVQIRTVAGWYLEGLRDILLLQKVGMLGADEVSTEGYLKEWEEFLKTRPTSSQI